MANLNIKSFYSAVTFALTTQYPVNLIRASSLLQMKAQAYQFSHKIKKNHTRDQHCTSLTDTCVLEASMLNTILIDYNFPPNNAIASRNVHKNWVPFLDDCRIYKDCYCMHVKGSMRKHYNPEGFKNCWVSEKKKFIGKKCELNHPIPELDAARNCSCFEGVNSSRYCLFSDMRPLKIHAL